MYANWHPQATTTDHYESWEKGKKVVQRHSNLGPGAMLDLALFDLIKFMASNSLKQTPKNTTLHITILLFTIRSLHNVMI